MGKYHAAPKPTCLAVFMVNNLVLDGGQNLHFSMGFGGVYRYIILYMDSMGGFLKKNVVFFQPLETSAFQPPNFWNRYHEHASFLLQWTLCFAHFLLGGQTSKFHFFLWKKQNVLLQQKLPGYEGQHCSKEGGRCCGCRLGCCIFVWCFMTIVGVRRWGNMTQSAYYYIYIYDICL